MHNEPAPLPALLDVIVIGGGPTGLACAIEARRAELSALVIEKGCLVNSLYHYPTAMVFFTTPELLEIGDLPFVCERDKPNRIEALKYYRRVADTYQLPIRQYEKVVAVSGQEGDFTVRTEQERTEATRTYKARRLIIAIGYYDHANLMGIPGEDLPRVSHYYRDAHPFYQREVAVIGAGNSAALAALDLYRHGAHVTLIHRGHEVKRSIKYWILPDLENRLAAGEIRAHFRTVVTEITPAAIRLHNLDTNAVTELANDFVFAMTGYHTDNGFLRALGVAIDPETTKPAFHPDTLESNVPGVYLAGVVIAGRETGKIFIENGRFHGKQIIAAMTGSREKNS
ncbi:MAG: YpdA family putative bacillithiol disulfide reductase [Blastocatellia bacterium]